MSVINGSADGGVGQQIHQSIDLNQKVHPEPELNSSDSDNLSELQSSIESMLTKELEEEKSEEMEDVVQPSMENGEHASEEIVMQLQPTVLKTESEQSAYRAASPPAPPPPSPISFISMEPPNPADLLEVDSGNRMANLVLMGCNYCYIYVMVSDADPKCTKCGSYDLVDHFRGNSGLCKRKKN